jgi:hypothetical protein
MTSLVEGRAKRATAGNRCAFCVEAFLVETYIHPLQLACALYWIKNFYKRIYTKRLNKMTTLSSIKKVCENNPMFSGYLSAFQPSRLDEEDVYESDFASTDEDAGELDVDGGEMQLEAEAKALRKVTTLYNIIHITLLMMRVATI